MHDNTNYGYDDNDVKRIVANNVQSRINKYDKQTREMLDSYADDPYTQQWLIDNMEKD